MLHDAIHPPDQPHMEQVSSPLSAQILEFCESDLFQETNIQNSDVASASNCCYEEQSSYVNSISFPPDMIKYPTPPTTTTATTTTTTDDANGNYPGLFEEKNIENEISAPQDFSNLPEYPFSHQDQFDLSLLQNQLQYAMDGPIMPYPHPNDQTDVLSMMGLCENECMSMPPSKCMRLNNIPSSPNHCFLDPPYFPSRNSNSMLPIESCGIFNGSLSFTNEIQAHELDFLGDNGGVFFPDPLPRPYNSNELQALSNESQHLVNNGGGSCNHPLAPPEITSLESESFRGTTKLTSEERKEKIHRYMKKRNERNFSKKIKYACRKTLADSRPRVRGRFAKNDEFGEHHRNSCNTHEEDTDEDVKSMHVMVKEEEKLDSSDIFAHISGLNSFRCNYPIQSWI
ncbi:putative transcription factor C2C2-CO-like family [Helianthus annuus]|uniref:Putative CCT motif family protein n=2 Tax=Helianthus annuus TaxID=4232 RepID=A0A251SFF8_HELAN|nr:putative transcription factor C2C2-CO-like family [Helianthus annuus]KAJ0484973.1 putative transcription factor C2C2-CO-like family [Helianthus annuus]KAJ0655524.1 putative transcription factor C2C2-CO-like family [Helianthus annuus]KAJ0659209.1 putative transcription factor C2C2-CO-like family [Helianthus annuus]